MAFNLEIGEVDQSPISLYLKLEQGARTDLVTVARIAIEFAMVVEEIAAQIYPDVVVSIEAVDATEGSFSWNSVIKLYRNAELRVLAGVAKHPKAAFLVAYVAMRIMNNAADWSQEKIMDWLASSDAPAEVREIDADDRKALAEDIARELRNGAGKAPAGRLYREVRRDPQIEAIGISSRAGATPHSMVEKADFERYQRETAREGQRRTVTRKLETTLVSPVLIEGDRRWKFRSAAGEFGAPMKDTDFLHKVLSGEEDIRLRAGLVMRVDLETTEEYQNGAWSIMGRQVTKVHGWRNAPVQHDWLFSASAIEKDDKGDDEAD